MSEFKNDLLLRTLRREKVERPAGLDDETGGQVFTRVYETKGEV